MLGCREPVEPPQIPLRLAGTLMAMGLLATVVCGAGAMAQEAVDVLPTTTSTAATGGPEILRGSVAPPPLIEPAAGPADRQLLAGDRLWLVDDKSRKLIGCRLVQTIYVDGLAIQCRERRLPRGAVADR